MSNVLIGIIGVILFIGLALAGALFLGSRFQEATINSKASAIVQITQQLSNAAQLKNLNEGVPTPVVEGSDLVAAGYLKSAPMNPVETEWGTGILDENGGRSGKAAYGQAAMYFFPDDAGKAKNRSDICANIARRSGQTMPADGGPPKAAKPTGEPSGCIKLTQDWGINSTGLYIVWSRI